MSFKDNLLTLMNEDYANRQHTVAVTRLPLEDYRYQQGILEGFRIVNSLMKNLEAKANAPQSPRLVTGEDAA